ncbi:hypothetical protein Micbo1qcDRAFT_156714 [Microdochium bolleyi]|uniref:Uncharacterized protein n=1 Tax=Microdochium bolleyi TaxID=196109 RepID=A0A136JKQ6_9PEZI|nr:hypothetical protein Micbo1qcDRAFT_156714 [Microdochium bolleyi]
MRLAFQPDRPGTQCPSRCFLLNHPWADFVVTSRQRRKPCQLGAVSCLFSILGVAGTQTILETKRGLRGLHEDAINRQEPIAAETGLHR